MNNNQYYGTFADDRKSAQMNYTPSKKRSIELQLLASQILAASGADVSQEVAIRPLAKAMAKLSGCGYRTAVRHIEFAIEQTRNKTTD